MLKCKFLKATGALLLSVMALFLFSVTAFADSRVSIRTLVSDTHQIKTESDGASVYYNGKSLQEVAVDRLSQPKLLICPNEGRIVKTVTLNGVDITNNILGGYYTLPPVYRDMILRVQTAAAPKVAQGQHSLTGTLTQNGLPLANVMLRLDSFNQEYVTNANGGFSFNKVETGHHTLTAIKDGVVIGYAEFTVENGEETLITNDDDGKKIVLSVPKNVKSISLSVLLSENGALELKDAHSVQDNSFLSNISPQTGESSNLLFGVASLLVSAVALTVLGINKKRGKNSSRV